MQILVLNGSPRPNGNTQQMIAAFREGAESVGHKVNVIIYISLEKAEMLVIASPIYYHGFTGQLKCALDRFYAVAYPEKPKNLNKVALILSSGDPQMYDGALFSYRGDFLEFLGLEDMGVFTAYGNENGSDKKRKELYNFGRSLVSN